MRIEDISGGPVPPSLGTGMYYLMFVEHFGQNVFRFERSDCNQSVYGFVNVCQDRTSGCIS